MGMKSTSGEIIQVQGGHIVRSTGRKDRHSKVYTAKGPRDRRVRLSAHTAIQFYDVQDRLGYDRPSKAVDWLIKKAKSAIDKLAELPPWHPTSTDATAAAADPGTNAVRGSTSVVEQHVESSGYGFQLHSNNSSFIPPPLDTEAIADPMKSFFPKCPTTSSINFQAYPHEIISRTTNQAEDLCLSLHPFQDPQGESNHTASSDQTLFAGSAPVAFEADSGGWSEHQPSLMSRFQRMVAWNGGSGDTDNRGGFIFGSMPSQPPLISQGSQFSQRGPLQSTFAQSVRAWNDLPILSADHHHKTQPVNQSGAEFAAEEFLPFRIPTRIHCEEGHGVVSERPSPSSPNSRR